RLELLLPRAIGTVRMPVRRLAPRVQREELARNLLGALLDPPFGSLPFATAQARQRRMRLCAADVPVDPIEVLHRDEEPIGVRVLQQHVLVLRARVIGDASHLDEPADAVIAMDDKVAWRVLEDERLARGAARRGPARTARRRRLGASNAPREWRATALAGAEQLRVGVDIDTRGTGGESLRQIPGDDQARPAAQRSRRCVEFGGVDGVEPMLSCELFHATLLPG